jgi:itaconate CoA-transferase
VLPLDGIVVVSCEQAVAAPFATSQLAELGARVIKVERSGDGDFARSYDTTVSGQSSHFVWLNRKESLALDLKADAGPHGAGVMRRLLERADVFVQNFAPGVAERLGLGHEELRARHPWLVTHTNCCTRTRRTGGASPTGPVSPGPAWPVDSPRWSARPRWRT